MGRLRVGTLVLIRWIAVGGQTIAVLAVHFAIEYPLPLVPCLAVIAATVVSNIWLYLRRAPRARLSDREAAIYLGFDLMQLTVLLYLTGGVHNPFVILILAPVTVSATLLSRTATVALVALAIACITAVMLQHLPLPWSPGAFYQPAPYVLGIWTSVSVATVFIAAYVWSVAEEARRMSEALAETRQALLREQRFTALGGLAAAAAHELGSPLATIAVVAKELSRSVAEDSPMAEDIGLLLSQSDRCREILAELSRRPEEMGGMPFELMPLGALIEEAVAHAKTGQIQPRVVRASDPTAAEPQVVRSPDVLLALGTLVQNATQFARENVEVRILWTPLVAEVVIADDGPGFAPDVLAALGEPYVSSRAGEEGHMGLGIFIAQTVLERTGAELEFRNRNGAEVVIRWPRAMLESMEPFDSGAGGYVTGS
ncbi:MAG: ActS/PrrB/RegB family redox-sensitive histidine kinase [Rhodospirillales bacterium]|nr:MAG: ActS/PrrB/RegB family redox-sensitive histidine kinase [Rhodospirillales bacterium]